MCMQVYHSMMTKYMPKRIQFSREGMEARTQLAALDHNFNAGREQATTSTGQPQYKVQFSRVKGDFVAKKIYSEKKYGCMHSMMQQVSDVATKRLTVPPIQKCKPVNVSRRGAPVKATVVANLIKVMVSIFRPLSSLLISGFFKPMVRYTRRVWKALAYCSHRACWDTTSYTTTHFPMDHPHHLLVGSISE
eukprot:scpid85357/ scgid5468/ 